ncbi:GIY-YIG nuclease family protein [Agrococcus sp. Marseille-Q4369]|uniref:GIY-YIG nuclease family protein n=1 Tax=Agrococcus sp. Marseille-Q4369 TaxID=2810513 RepID=UPI001B8B0AC9|nr:GIY-YIG nuclease family protein [Agrococcus sp. Marseille-Q4369]QUW18060.1 GIY-YIG nuclease family protein [Agrococcus sp. Marseille-Q4369]
MAWVYMLRCSDGSYYVGSTGVIEQRLQEHADGKGAEYTKRRLPVELVWAEELDGLADAYAMERRIHGWSRAKKEALIAGDWERIRSLARRRGVEKVKGRFRAG